MNLVVDGEIYVRQVKGGISRIYNEVLPRMCDQDSNLDIRILIDGHLKQHPPVHSQINHYYVPPLQRYFRPGRLWKPIVSEMKWASRRSFSAKPAQSIWQATFYTPPRRWPGRFVVFFYDLIEERFPELFTSPQHDELRRKKRASAQSADIIICISRSTQADVCAQYHVSVDKTRVVNLAASPTFRPLTEREMIAVDATYDRPFILYIGNRSQYKNFDLLLQAYAGWESHRNINLWVVGDTWTDTEAKRLGQLGITQSVRLLEHVDDETLNTLYNKTSAFVYPSLYEGFGIPLLEAMNCGCAIVASDIATSHEVAGDYPHYFKTDDVDGLRAALDLALEHKRSDRTITAVRHITAEYNWDNTARQIRGIYDELREGKVWSSRQ